MEQITPSITQIEELLSEFELQYAEKSNMPLDWVSQYKTFQSHNITIENWNILNTYIHNVLSDTKSSYEFIISSMNLLFDTLKTLEDNDVDFSNRLTEIQSYLNLHKDLFNKGIIYIPGIVEGNAALSDLKEDQIILSIKYRTSIYVGGTELSAFQLFKVSNGKYVGIYTAEIEYIDLIIKHDKTLSDHAKKLTEIDATLNNLHLERFVQRTELSDVAFTGEYSDLKGKPSIPTKVSDLVNDSGFITNAVSDLVNYYTKNETFTKQEILSRIDAIKTIKFEIYASLDAITSPQTNVIYLIGTESPYTEYAYIEGIGFEAIGSTAIDLSGYVKSYEELTRGDIIVAFEDNMVASSGIKFNTSNIDGQLLDNDNVVPTSALVKGAIEKLHNIMTINGDSGYVSSLELLNNAYSLIVDENLLVYRRISNDNSKLVYHSQQVIDETHIRDWYLRFGIGSVQANYYVRTYVENVSHEEFDELVASTPTDVIYDKDTKVVQLTHDGTPIGEGAVVDINGFTPWFDGETLVLSDVEELNADVATKEYVEEKSTKYVVINDIPTSATSGTITNEQLSVLLENKSNYIQFFNENFYPQDVEISEGYIVYSHVGNREGVVYNKTFTLNTASGDWTLKEVLVQEVIDISSWFTGGYEGEVPEEYRNIELLKKSILIKDSEVYTFTSGRTIGGEFYPAWSYVDADTEEGKLYCRSISIFEDWTLEVFGFKTIQIGYIANSSQIIEDQGKLELVTYNQEGLPIDTNDSPNIYLQRRLDKPNKKWEGQELDAISDDLEILRDNGTLKPGVSLLKISESNDYISEWGQHTIWIYQGEGGFDSNNNNFGTSRSPLVTIVKGADRIVITNIYISDYTNELKYNGYSIANSEETYRIFNTADMDKIELFF